MLGISGFISTPALDPVNVKSLSVSMELRNQTKLL